MAAFGMKTEEVLSLTTAFAELEVATTALNNAYNTLGKMNPSELPVRTMKQRMRKTRALARQIGKLVETMDEKAGEEEASRGGNVVLKHGEESTMPASATTAKRTSAEAVATANLPASLAEDDLQAIEEQLRQDPTSAGRMLVLDPAHLEGASILLQLREGGLEKREIPAGQLGGGNAEHETKEAEEEVSARSP